MIESLRRWGGSFAKAPVFAVTPRHGPNLSSDTLNKFDRLEVRYIRRAPKTRYPWFRFYNKPLVLAIVEEIADTEAICWLDSDILVVAEPEALRLGDTEDFTACTSDIKEMGTSGIGDAFEPLWRANCQVLGIDIEKLPWLVTEHDGVRIRLYWNGGILVYRRLTGFGRHYLKACTQLMDARNRPATVEFSIGINEMSAIGLSMHLMGLKWRALPFSHDYSMGSRIHSRWYREEQLRSACIVHYHDAMWPWFWDTFIQCFQSTHPPVAEWLEGLGPLRNQAHLFDRILGKGFRIFRDRQERNYLTSCHTV